MRIAVYSGSFDPLHIGHKAIMEYLTQTSDFDWVYLVISPQNPFKDKDKGTTRYAPSTRSRSASRTTTSPWWWERTTCRA